MLRFERSIEVSSSQYGSKGCTSVMTCTRRPWATSKLHSVRKVAFAVLAPLGVNGWDGREDTRRDTWRVDPPADAGPVLGRRGCEGCISSGTRDTLLAFDGESSS